MTALILDNLRQRFPTATATYDGYGTFTLTREYKSFRHRHCESILGSAFLRQVRDYFSNHYKLSRTIKGRNLKVCGASMTRYRFQCSCVHGGNFIVAIEYTLFKSKIINKKERSYVPSWLRN